MSLYDWLGLGAIGGGFLGLAFLWCLVRDGDTRKMPSSTPANGGYRRSDDQE